MPVILKRILFTVIFFTFCYDLQALDVPALGGRINDYADIISPAAENEINAVLLNIEKTDSTQIVVLTIPSLKGDSLENFSIRVAEKWKIGQKNLDNGVILLVSKADRKVKIEVGYGLEGRLTDLLAGRIIDDVIIPRFREGNFDAGMTEGVNAIVSAVKGEYKADITGKNARREQKNLFPLVFLLVFIGIIGSIKRIMGGAAGAVIFPLTGYFLFPAGLWLLLLIPAGFLAGLALPSVLLAMGSARGGFHAGSGGLGGGFSSFGGGGGGFGGGGASGSW